VKADGTEVLSCALITTPANELMAQIHNEKLRMPAVLREEDHDAWLRGSVAEAKSVLTPYPSDIMVTWQVSRRLYANKGPNDASLIEPADGQ
jgi:putative SOS response-associated peptidase YedK